MNTTRTHVDRSRRILRACGARVKQSRKKAGRKIGADLWRVIGAQLPDAEAPIRAEAQQVVAHAEHGKHRLCVAPIHAGPASKDGQHPCNRCVPRVQDGTTVTQITLQLPRAHTAAACAC